MGIVRFDGDCDSEIGSTRFVVDDECAQDPKLDRVVNWSLHREVLLKHQTAILGEQRLQLADVLR